MATAEQPDSTSVAMEQVSTEEAKATNEEANRGTSPAAEAAAEATGPASEAAAVADAAVTESSCDDDRSNGSSSRDEDTDDDETETTEESPCGRWLKRREEIKYRDVPGIDTAFLAMDSEEGVEVVWNEAQFSSSKKFKAQEEKLRSVFDALTKIEHANIVHFHHYWLDPGSGGVGAGAEGAAARQERKLLPRLIFITEYMSSGSLKQFLRKTKKNNRKIQLQSWKRWSTQILYALSYLHQRSDPAIIHGNLTCDTIFIQHNGLVKVGSIAPDVIHQNVRANRDHIKNLHYLAPEWNNAKATPGTPSDIFSFGIAALETAALDIQSMAPAASVAAAAAIAAAASATTNGTEKKAAEVSSSLPSAASSSATSSDAKQPASASVASSSASSSQQQQQLPLSLSQSQQQPGTSSGGGASSGTENPPSSTGTITEEQITAAIDQLENEQQKDFIRLCLRRDPKTRPTAIELLFHPAIFEVHSLKLLAAHVLVNSSGNTHDSTMTDEAIQAHYGHKNVMATVTKGGEQKEYKLKDLAPAEKLEKFVEDVRFGIYPITNFGLNCVTRPKNRAITPETQTGHPQKKTSLEEKDLPSEHRRISQALISIGPSEERPGTLDIILVLRFNEGKNRLLVSKYNDASDQPDIIVADLIREHFINVLDRQFLEGAVADAKRKLSLVAAEFLSNAIASGKTIGVLIEEYREVAGLDERLKQLTSGELTAKDNIFVETKYYRSENAENPDEGAARDPNKAKDMRDPFNITTAFPMPEGSHFCPPVGEEGSTPFKEMAPGTNAFDYSQIEEQLKKAHDVQSKQQLQQTQQQPQQQGGDAAAATATQDPGATMPFTPQTDAPYDPYAYLQGAQKELERLQTSQQQLLAAPAATQQQQIFTPSVTPGGHVAEAAPVAVVIGEAVLPVEVSQSAEDKKEVP